MYLLGKSAQTSLNTSSRKLNTSGVGGVQAAQNLMGVEGCCWTEYCPTTWKVELQVFPRMAALAEKAWTGKNDDWEGFTRRLTHQLDLYDLWGIRYNDVVERTLIAPRQR